MGHDGTWMLSSPFPRSPVPGNGTGTAGPGNDHRSVEDQLSGLAVNLAVEVGEHLRLNPAGQYRATRHLGHSDIVTRTSWTDHVPLREADHSHTCLMVGHGPTLGEPPCYRVNSVLPKDELLVSDPLATQRPVWGTAPERPSVGRRGQSGGIMRTASPLPPTSRHPHGQPRRGDRRLRTCSTG